MPSVCAGQAGRDLSRDRWRRIRTERDIPLDAIRGARQRIPVVCTALPMLSSRAAARTVADRHGVAVSAGPVTDGQPRIFVKAEHLQVTGSFKPRGATNRVLSPDR